MDTGSRLRPDRKVITWRTTGLAVALADSSRPFFIEWPVPAELHPGRTPARHRVAAPTLGRVELAGDEAIVRAWLGADEPAVVVRPGAPSITAVVVASPAGEDILGAGDWH